MKKTLWFALTLVITLNAGCNIQKEIYSRPDEEIAETAKIYTEDTTVRYKDEAIMIEMSYLYPRNVDTYFEYFRDGRFSNPFSPEAHMVFTVTIENLSDGVLNYNPRLTMLITGSESPVTPKDYASLYTDFELVDSGDTEIRMQAFKASCFDNSIIIQPGERVRKLMVFPRRDETGSGGVFLFGSVYLGYKSRDIPIDFRGDFSAE